MGQEKLWLLHVTLAAVLCLAYPSLCADSVVRGRVGGTAELGCSLPSLTDEVTTPNQLPLHVVEWVRLGYNVPILIKFGGYTPRVHPDYKGRVSLIRGASLVVDGLTLEDEGWFECRILLLDRTTDEFRNGTWTFLSITAPPVFIKMPPAFVEVLLGESLTLSCVAHGNPKPSITWTKDDITVEEHDKIQVINGTLSLVKVTRETAGMYKCHVSNSEGNLTHVTQLQVKGPPVIINPPKNSTFNMSQDATLQCQADAHPSNLTYEWRKEEQNVYHVESLKSRVKILVDGTLLIPDLIPEDSGNYTCIPTNGLLTPPSASAYLKVKHPARVVRMPRETYLPTGMGGTIVCPVQAEPPMLFVNWTKDGKLLDLRQYPGWTVNSEGSVFISTVNDNAVGMYTCTAYNSYGTMGQSEPTKVILKDPPSFRVAPRSEYLQEVGRELMIPCQAQGDPSPNITWTKVGSKPHSLYNILSNGSLVLQPLSKDHQGAWKCHATNSVATVSKGTIVLVLGTSPHAATAVSVDPGINHANVSWKPGFDGGYTQTFTVWVKSTTKVKHEWASIPVPTSKSSLLVAGLQAATSYQFSVLPQNKLGSGPFSEIVTMRTLALPTDPPTEITNLATPAAPTLLSVNYTAAGVLLQWLPPPAESPPITAFMLQAKQEKGDWITLNEAIDVNVTSIIVLGLTRDSSYELRLLSQRDGLVSEPSESVNVSTIGMVMYPAPASLLTFVSEPLMAGVIAGVCFLFMAIFLSVVAAYVMNHRREQHRRKRRDDIQSAFQKPQSPQAFLPNSSPDSLLKMKLCPPLSFFPNSSSSDRSDRSSFDRGSRSEYQDQKKQLLSSSPPLPCYTVFESHLGSSQSPTSAINSISRGPDGRFNAQPYPEGCIPTCITKNQDRTLSPGQISDKGSSNGSFRDSPKSCSDMSEKDVKQEPSTGLTIDSAQSNRIKSMSSTLSQHGCFYSDKDQICSETHLKKASFNSNRQENGTREPSTMVSQLESEQGLMKESEGSYTVTQRAQECKNTQERAKSASPMRSWSGAELEDPVWKPQDIQLRQKNKRPSSLAHRRGCYFGNTSSPMDRQLSSLSSHVQWDISPVISPTSQVPVLELSDGSTPRCLQPDTTQEDVISVEDSAAEDLQSSVTQYTSVSILSHSRDVSSVYGSDLSKTQAKCPERLKDREQESFASSTGADKYWRQDTKTGTQPNVSTSICPAPCSPQASEMASEKIQHNGEEREQETSPKLDTYTSHSISGCPTILYNQQKKERERKTDEPSSSFLHTEEEKECVRSRSRKSDKCALSSSPSRISPLTLLQNESESNKSDSSMIRLSESLKAKFVPQPARMSSLQTSAILEYLSLPGFVEMSVDEPTEESQQEQESSSPGTEPENKTLLRREPDVVPKNWEIHGQEHSGVMPSIPVVQVKSESVTSPELGHKCSGINIQTSKVNSVAHQERRFQSLHSQNIPDKHQPTQLSPAQPSASAAKNVVGVVSNIPYQVGDVEESSKQTQEYQTRNNGHNKVTMRISQAPVPFLKKSISVDPCRTLDPCRTQSGMGQPHSFLRKSFSLGSQRWENYESSRNFVSKPSFKDALPHMDARAKSYGYTHTSGSSYFRPGPSRPGAVPFKPSGYILERPYCNQIPYMTHSPMFHAHGHPVLDPPKFVEPYRRESDPRRQATVFPESSGCPLSYREALRSVQHKYIPQDPRQPYSAHRPVTRWDHPHSLDFKRGHQRGVLPRDYSCPSFHQAVPPPGEIQREFHGVVGTGKPSRDMKSAGDEGRASYASQSSGRGSVGPYGHGHLRQSLSITPTLISSPETTEETERHRREPGLREKKLKRRNTSVDESYEWDASECPIGIDLLEAMKMERTGMRTGRGLRRDWSHFTTGLQELQETDPHVSISCPPVSHHPPPQYGRSLSEARFNALMQEFQKHRRAQDPCLPPDPDSDSGSALL